MKYIKKFEKANLNDILFNDDDNKYNLEIGDYVQIIDSIDSINSNIYIIYYMDSNSKNKSRQHIYMRNILTNIQSWCLAGQLEVVSKEEAEAKIDANKYNL